MPPARKPRGRAKKFDPIDRAAAKPPTGKPRDLSAHGFEHATEDEPVARGVNSGIGAIEAVTESTLSEFQSTSPNFTQSNDNNESSTSNLVPRLAPAPTPAPAAAPAQSVSSLKAPKSVGPGHEEAYFTRNERWQQDRERYLGAETKEVKFSNFILKDVHIDELIAMGSAVCRNLEVFMSYYHSSGSESRNYAKDLTEEAVIRLAENCPNLRKVKLECTKGLTDRALTCFFEKCPNLTDLAITALSQGDRVKAMTGTAFDDLRETLDLAPKLIELRVELNESKTFMKAMRDLTIAREKLLVQLVRTDELWHRKEEYSYLHVHEVNYLKGRKRERGRGGNIKRGEDGYTLGRPAWVEDYYY